MMKRSVSRFLGMALTGCLAAAGESDGKETWHYKLQHTEPDIFSLPSDLLCAGIIWYIVL